MSCRKGKREPHRSGKCRISLQQNLSQPFNSNYTISESWNVMFAWWLQLAIACIAELKVTKKAELEKFSVKRGENVSLCVVTDVN